MSNTCVDQWKEEAHRGYERLCHDRDSIFPHLRSDPSIRPPYTVTQITEGALRRETRRIHTIAKQHTSQIYDIGIDTTRTSEGSWIVRWLLWNTMKTGGKRDGGDKKDDTAEYNAIKDCQQTSSSSRKQVPDISAQESKQGRPHTLLYPIRIHCSDTN